MPARAQRLTDLARHPEIWVTVRQVAEYYECSDWNVREWIRAGLLAASNLGGRRLTKVRMVDLRAFDARQRIRPEGG